MGTYAVTGSASGIGAATAERLRGDGHDVIGVDRSGTGADVEADLATPAGRAFAVGAVAERCGGVLDGAVPCAGLGPVPTRPGADIVAVNYFGTVEVLDGLRPLLAAATSSAVVAISSNSTTTAPGVPAELVRLCLVGDEPGARACADDLGAMQGVYPASKLALARWVRANAVTEAWTGAGIRLNAVAPGMVQTAMIDEGRADPTVGPLLDLFPIPVGRPGRPEEIAAVIAFLLGPDAGFFCGSVVFADGGTDALLRTEDWPAAWGG